MICIGHRGAKGHAPENTLLSVKTALEMGVDWIEVDVYAIENRLIVFHDEYLDRTTNGSGLIYNQSVDYLRSLDAGQGEKIPFLGEVLEVINGAAGINVELKGPGTAGLVAELLGKVLENATFSAEQVLVSSFNHRELQRFKNIAPDIPIGALVSCIPLQLAHFAERLQADAVNASLEFVNREFVEDAQQRGMKFLVYTVNSHQDLQRMADLGVDGVFTDYPEIVKGREGEK